MTRARRILQALETGPQTTGQLCQPDVGGVRFGARLMELRAQGYTILEERLSQSSHLYRLAGRPARQLSELRCQLGHSWMGSCRRDARGYPFVAGAVPSCPVCAREACAVETFMSPAHPDVVAKAAA